MTVAIALALASNAHVAHAAPNDDAHRRAAESFQQAQAAFTRGEFAAAAAAFEQAAYYEPHPAPLLNAAEAWEKAGELARAAEDCDRVLAMNGVEEKYRAEATKRLSALSPQIATVDFVGPRTIVVRVDANAETGVPSRKRLAPGHHALTMTDLTSSQSRRAEVDLKKGETRTVDVTPGARSPMDAPPPLTETPADPKNPDPSATISATTTTPPADTTSTAPSATPPSTSHVASYAFFGGAGAAAIVAGVFGAQTMASKDDYDANATPATRDAFHRNKAITNVAVGVAAALAATGVVLWIVAPKSDASPAVGVGGGGGGGGVIARVRF